jgi:hypothetical protein
MGIFSVAPTEPSTLGSTQPLKVSTRDFSWGKGGRCLRLTTYHPCSAEQESPGPLHTRYPLGHLGLLRDDLYIYHYYMFMWVLSSMYSTHFAKQTNLRRKEFGVGGLLYFSCLFSEIFFIKGYLFYRKNNLRDTYSTFCCVHRKLSDVNFRVHYKVWNPPQVPVFITSDEVRIAFDVKLGEFV